MKLGLICIGMPAVFIDGDAMCDRQAMYKLRKDRFNVTRGYGDRSRQDATPLELDILVIVVKLVVVVINVPDIINFWKLIGNF